MADARKLEVDQNYDFFQRNLSSLLVEHRGKFVLLRNASVVGFFDGPGDALRAGLERFADELFSIQEVEDRPAEMGLISLAFD